MTQIAHFARRLVRELRLPFLALAAALGVRLFLISPYLVEGSSMSPTIEEGRVLLGEQISPRLGLHPGDIVVVEGVLPLLGEAAIIKRVIAVGPAFVEFRDGAVYVDGQLIEEDYLPAGTTTVGIEPRYEVAPGEVFLLGDNRGGSLDSRIIGAIPVSEISARLLLILPAP